MAEIDQSVRQKLNSEFARRIDESLHNPFDVIIEVEPSSSEVLAQQFANIPGAQIDDTGVIGPAFISATLTEEALSAVSQLDEVVLVHQDQLVGVKEQESAGQSLPLGVDQIKDFPFLTPKNDPIRAALSEAIFE